MIVQTYEAKIFVGSKENYDGVSHTYNEALALCQKYCDSVGLGVTVFVGTCVYTKGNEKVFQIGLINYPRFQSTPPCVYQHAVTLGKMIASEFKQQRFTIVATDKTEMFEAPY